MKYLIASDIHGSALWCRRLLSAFDESGADRLVLLGDILYHGPRNSLPGEYDPKAVVEMLTPYKEKILAVRGNCDTEVDQMVLPFFVMASYAVLSLGEKLYYLTHGHKLNGETPLPLCPGDTVVYGHTHIPEDRTANGIRYLNPGSVSIPKGGSDHGYLLLTEEDCIYKILPEV